MKPGVVATVLFLLVSFERTHSKAYPIARMMKNKTDLAIYVLNEYIYVQIYAEIMA